MYNSQNEMPAAAVGIDGEIRAGLQATKIHLHLNKSIK